MELNHLRAFYEVAKSGSFTEAARRLHISQSALSKAVALLEESEGVRLLERSKKGVSLTALGADVFARSEVIFATLTEIESTCRGTKEVCEGALRLGASDHVTNYLLLQKAGEMRAAHPKVIPSIFSGAPNEIVEKILSQEIEFGLFFTKLTAPQISYEVLSSIPMAVVCKSSLLTELGRRPSKQKLRKLFSEVGYISSIGSHYQNHPSKDLIELLGDDPKISLESNSQEAQKRAAIKGMGIAFLARFMVEEELASGELAEIELDNPLELNLHLAKRRGKNLSLNAKTFIESYFKQLSRQQ